MRNGRTFSIKRLVVKRSVAEEVSAFEINRALECHVRGDWEDLENWDAIGVATDPYDARLLLSTYRSTHGVPFWIITTADRSCTTVLLPEDSCGECAGP